MEGSRELLKHLMGEKCVCGAWKAVRMSHCKNCYASLPSTLKKNLYRRFGNGYEEAYAKSITKLRELGRVI